MQSSKRPDEENLAKAPSTMAADAYGVPQPGFSGFEFETFRTGSRKSHWQRLTPACPVLLLAVAADEEHPVKDSPVAVAPGNPVLFCDAGWEAAEDLASALPNAELEVGLFRLLSHSAVTLFAAGGRRPCVSGLQVAGHERRL